MSRFDELKIEIDGGYGTFLNLLRCELRWDWDAFYKLTSLMYDVAELSDEKEKVEKYIAHGFWFIDTWVKAWTGHKDFPRPEKEDYEEAIELLHDLCYYYFIGESPFTDNTLKEMAKNDT